MRTYYIRFLLAFAALLLSTQAHADTITFASQAGSTSYWYAYGHGSTDGTTGVAVAYNNSAYAAPLAGSQWVSTDANGGDGTYSYTAYFSTITLKANETYSGSLSFMADDWAGVWVNNTNVFAINPTTGYSSSTTIDLLSSYFQAGDNTVALVTYNAGGGPAAVNYQGSVSSAVTPEPSTFALLGTGAVGGAGLLRRRFNS